MKLGDIIWRQLGSFVPKLYMGTQSSKILRQNENNYYREELSMFSKVEDLDSLRYFANILTRVCLGQQILLGNERLQ